MLKQKMKKAKFTKRQIQTDIPPWRMLLHGGIGVLLGVAAAFLFLVLSALIMKFCAADLSSVWGWTLAVKLLAPAVSAIVSVYGGGKVQGLRGAGTGAMTLLTVNLILTCAVPFYWAAMLADLGLGAAVGLAISILFSFVKK